MQRHILRTSHMRELTGHLWQTNPRFGGSYCFGASIAFAQFIRPDDGFSASEENNRDLCNSPQNTRSFHTHLQYL